MTAGSGSRWEAVEKGESYDAKWQAMARAGRSIHGEADLVESLGPQSVLDAGCGTGRVAIELASRGIETVGIDVDVEMLGVARGKAPELTWLLRDLSERPLFGDVVEGSRSQFDVVVAAGNVMIFVEPEALADVISNLAGALVPGGRLVAGFQLQPGSLSLGGYDEHCENAGLILTDRWSSWGRGTHEGGADYAVSVHRREL